MLPYDEVRRPGGVVHNAGEVDAAAPVDVNVGAPQYSGAGFWGVARE